MKWSDALLWGLVCCVCSFNTGCKSIKSPFPKMAFWKTNEPPKSELAARSRDAATLPSRSAEVIEGTTNPGSAYAQRDSGMGSPSAYNRTERYPQQRPDSNPLDAVRPASTFTANNTLNSGGLNSGGFDQSQGLPDYREQNRVANLGATADFGQASDSFGAASAAAELPGRYPTQLGNEPGQPFSQTPPYPSTQHASFSPKASNAVLESSLDASESNAISQASSNSALSAPPANKPALPPSLPVSALNRQGSYAPGSTGASARPVSADGFNPTYGTPSASRGACPSGCKCDHCQAPSGGDFLPRGSFYGN